MTGVQYGNADDVMPNVILRILAGSELYGTNIEGVGDRDEMGIYVGLPEDLLGIPTNKRADYLERTKGEGERSGAGDLDLVLYELRKWLGLAVQGNPNSLLPLWAPDKFVLEETYLGHSLRRIRDRFMSQSVVRQYLGYMHSQHERMMGGGKRNRVPNRPELVEKYGYDVKYAAHALRLAYEAWFIAETGQLMLPLNPVVRSHVLDVKTGCYKGLKGREVVSADIKELLKLTEKIMATSTPLPEHPDYQGINQWAIGAHYMQWGH